MFDCMFTAAKATAANLNLPINDIRVATYCTKLPS